MPHTLADLPYAYDTLEAAIDEQTMRLHHGKHHQAYVTNLNAALEKHPALFDVPLEELLADLNAVPEDIRTAVRNHGGGHFNHTLFWESMSPNGGGEPTGALAEAINAAFGSFDAFKAQFNDAGLKQFGSGWAWLVKTKSGELRVTSSANQDCPVSIGDTPLLMNDVWEHAYYLRYQNRRAEYLETWWKVVNWDVVSRRFAG